MQNEGEEGENAKIGGGGEHEKETETPTRYKKRGKGMRRITGVGDGNPLDPAMRYPFNARLRFAVLRNGVVAGGTEFSRVRSRAPSRRAEPRRAAPRRAGLTTHTGIQPLRCSRACARTSQPSGRSM